MPKKIKIRKKEIKLHKECFKCGYFDPEMEPGRYKCAVSRSCPGINWSDKRKQRAIEEKKELSWH